LETPVFDPVFTSKTGFFNSKTGFFNPKTGGFDPKLFPNYFRKIFAIKKTNISEKFPNFGNRTILKLAKRKVRKIPSFPGP
jgi:hypothetical protein